MPVRSLVRSQDQFFWDSLELDTTGGIVLRFAQETEHGNRSRY